MKSNSFYVIQGWMINELNLKGNNLLVFAVIYGFSKDGQGKFDGSLKYLCDCTGASKNTVIKSLNDLLDLGYILKSTELVSNITFCKYFQNDIVVQKLVRGSAETDYLGGAETAPNNIINNNIEDKKQILFSESIWNSYYSLKIELSKDEKFKKEYAGVDLKHYIEDVLLWSDSKNQKRTNKGWLATLRNWMKRDKTSNKLVLLEDFKQNKGGFTNH
ncbi:hypothetical protein [Flavobacterium phage V186]|nr:hypothetical protein [Flavobacterium phage V186]QNJ53908.1 hypothetical protein [Flavobacterium phage FCOV-F56]QNJ54134.1 hypothetical protein [Flavobacterium phage V186]